MILNGFFITGLRGEINDGENLLMSLFTHKEVLPEGVWATDNATFQTIIDRDKYSHIIFKELSDFSQKDESKNNYSSVSHFLSEMDKSNEVVNFYTNDFSFFKQFDDSIENINLILLNNMYENCNKFITLDEDYTIADDSDWVKIHDSQCAFKKLRYIKRNY
jgi:hypothetical protein